MAKRVDPLRQHRLEGSAEVKREGGPFQPGVLALHDRRGAFEPQLERVVDPE